MRTRVGVGVIGNEEQVREDLLLDPHPGRVQLAQERVADRGGIVDGHQARDAGAFVGVDGAAGAGGDETTVRGDVHVPRLDGDVGAAGEAAQDQDAAAIEIAGVADRQLRRRAEAQQHDHRPRGLAAREDHELGGRIDALDVVEERSLVLEDRDAARRQGDEHGVAELGGGEGRRIAEHGMARDMIEGRGAAGTATTRVDQRPEDMHQDAGGVAHEAPHLEGGGDGRGRRRGLADGDVGLRRRIVEEERGAEAAGALAAGQERLAVAEDAGGEVGGADGRAQLEHRVEGHDDVGHQRDRGGDAGALGVEPGVAARRRGRRALGGDELTRDGVAGGRERRQRGHQLVAQVEALGGGVAGHALEGGVEQVVDGEGRGHVAKTQARASGRERRDRARREDRAQRGDRVGIGVDGERRGQAAAALSVIEERVESRARPGSPGDGVADRQDDRVALHGDDHTAAARRLVGAEAGGRARAFVDGCAPALGRALDGRIAAVLTAERAPWYLTILYGMLLYRRDHELEPLHEDVLARVSEPLAALGGYDGALFGQDVTQLVEWRALDRITEAHKLRSYRDNRRERFRYRLTDDTVALLEWLEARLAAKLDGRAGDSRDRLEDVLGHLREVRRVLEEWRGGARDGDRARRALHLIEAIGDAIDEVGSELLAFRGAMLAFASRPYDVAALRAILDWLERYVAVYVRRLEELRTDVAARLRELGAPRFQESLEACHALVAEERAAAPRALRAAAVIAPGERIAAHATFFSPGGMLAALCARIDESARAVVIKMQRHLRELERRSARLADLRAAIRLVAAAPARDPRLALLGRALVAAAHVRVDRRPGSAAAPHAPPMPRTHTRVAPSVGVPPLARKRGSLQAARDLAVRRRAELGAWLAAFTDGADRRQLATLPSSEPGLPRRWLDVARAAHLGGGRALREAGFELETTTGEVSLTDDEGGLCAPDAWITRRR
jgi:hypothetical protein